MAVMTAADYADQLGRLLHRGRLRYWLLRDAAFSALLEGLGAMLARVHVDIDALPGEIDPRTTTRLLPDWETFCGLPDGCLPGGGTLTQRRNAVVARLTSTGGASSAYLIQQSAVYGYTVTIDELGPNHIRINSAESTAVVMATCNDDCDTPLRTWGNEQHQCLIDRIKPAHVQADYAYGS